jgi:hypothetical protein
MRERARQRGTIAGVALGAAAAVLVVATLAGADEDPTARYWTDGARPVVHGETAPPECVPYSAERADLSICGDLPEGWTPPPLPYADPQVCDAAIDWMDRERERMGEGGDEQWPAVDPDSCMIQQGFNGTWAVHFTTLADPEDGVVVPFDPTGEVGWAAHP